MKKLNFTMKQIIMFFALLSFSTISFAQFSGGTGTAEDPYQLGTREDLLALVDSCYIGTNAAAFPAANYILTANIEMQDGDVMHPIGTEKYPASFSGTFDGMNYVIKNAYIIPDTAAAAGSVNGGCAFIGRLTGTIRNLGLIDIEVYNKNNGAKANMVAAVAGQVNGTALIENCFVLGGNVWGDGSWGTAGIAAGSWAGGRILNCFYEGTIKAGYGVRTMFSMPQASSKDGSIPTSIDSCISYATFTGGGADAISAPQGVQNNNYYISTVGKDDANATKLSPFQMTKEANFENLDFTNTWVMSQAGGYPVLKSFENNAAIDYSILKAPTKPVANGGGNQNVEGTDTVWLDGSASVLNADPETNSLTYSWVAVGSATALSATDVAKPFFVAPAVTEVTKFQYVLTVNNGIESSDADTVNINIAVKVALKGDTLDRTAWEFIDASSDAANGGGEAHRANLIDGDVTTNWSSEWQTANFNDPADQAFPIHFTLDMKRLTDVQQIIYVPRQDQWGPGGHPYDYEIYFTNDLNDWGTKFTGNLGCPYYDKETLTDAEKEEFKATKVIDLDGLDKEVRYIKFVALNQGTPQQNPHVCFSELYIMGAYKDAEFGAMTIDAGDAQTAKVNEEVMLDASASTTDERLTLTYEWTAPEGISLDDNKSATPKFTTDLVGVQTFYVTVNDGFNEAQEDSVKITIEALAIADVTILVKVDGEAFSGAYVTFDGAAETTGTDGTFTFTGKDVGTYTYNVVAGTNVVNDTQVTIAGDTTITVSFGQAALDNQLARSVKCYPNPVQNVMMVEAASAIQELSIFNLAGQSVYTATMNTVQTTVDMSTFNAGVYFTTVKGKGFSKTIRVIVE